MPCKYLVKIILSFAIIISVLCCCSFVCFAENSSSSEVSSRTNAADAADEMDNEATESGYKTIELTGSDTGIKQFDASYRTIILNNYNLVGKDDGKECELLVAGGTTVKLAPGSRNIVDCIHSMGSLKISGDGDLDATTGIIAESGLLYLNFTGNVVVNGGIVSNLEGDVLIRKGNLTVSKNENEESGYISSNSGDLTIEGGTVSADGVDYGIGAIGGKVIITDGEISAKGGDYAVMAITDNDSEEGISLSNDLLEKGLRVVLTQNSGSAFAYAVANSDKIPITDLNDPNSLTSGVYMKEDTSKVSSTESLTSEWSGDMSSGGSDDYLLYIIFGVAGLALVGIVVMVIIGNKKKNKKH